MRQQTFLEWPRGAAMKGILHTVLRVEHDELLKTRLPTHSTAFAAACAGEIDAKEYLRRDSAAAPPKVVRLRRVPRIRRPAGSTPGWAIW